MYGRRFRKVKKKPIKKKFGYRNVRKKYRKNLLINPFRNLSMLPSRLKTKCYMQFSGTFDTLTGPTVGYAIAVKASSLLNPFDIQATTSNGLLDPTGSFDQTTDVPYGLSRLLNMTGTATAPYDNYRVFASSIAVNMNPNDADDDFVVSVYPLDIVETLKATSATRMLDPVWFGQVPNRVGPKQININDTNRNRILKNYCTTSKILGITKRSVQDNDTTAANGNSSPVAWWNWIISFRNLKNQNFQDKINIVIKVQYWIELFGVHELGQSIIKQ